jgi:hypothetical protein
MTHESDQDDFGFALVSAEEMNAANQKILSSKLTEAQNSLSERHRSNLLGLKNIIMPLLNGLKADPEKEWMNWPTRAAEAQTIIDKIERYMSQCQ